VSKKMASILLSSFLVLSAASNGYAATAPAVPAPDGNKDVLVSSIRNVLTASKQRDLHAGDVINWSATTEYRNESWGPIPPITYWSNFVVRVSGEHFNRKPVITARNLPSMCSDTEFVAIPADKVWEFRCGGDFFLTATTWSINFTTTASAGFLEQQRPNKLYQDGWGTTKGVPSIVYTGGGRT
jgi:hypothetical protein